MESGPPEAGGLFRVSGPVELVGQALRVFASDPLLFVLITASVYVPSFLVERVIGPASVGITFGQHSSSDSSSSSSGFNFHAGMSGRSLWANFVVLAAFGLAAGLTSLAVAQRACDQTPSLGWLARRLGVLGLLVVVTGGIAYGVLFSLGALLFVIPGIAIAIWLLPFAPVGAVERLSLWTTLGRAMRLVDGHWWYVFVAVVAAAVTVLVPEAVIAFFIMGVASARGQLSGSYPGPVVSFLWGILGGTLGLIFISVVYLQLRVRKEGLTAQGLASELRA